MSEDKWLSDQEFESLLRMARESSGFYEGLAKALGPQGHQAPSDKLRPAESVKRVDGEFAEPGKRAAGVRDNHAG